MKIDIKEVEFSPISVDDVGSLFFYEGRVFRAIKSEAVTAVKELFVSGLIEELVKEKLFPKSWITDFQLEDFGLIVEHERISPVVYACEWSFNMLRDAALVILQVNKVARKFNYQTKDCHTANVLFDCAKPKFIDLGSFIKLNKNDVGWLPREDFLRLYYYPLIVWAKGSQCFARSVFLSSRYATIYEFLLHLHPYLRLLKIDWLVRIAKMFFRYCQIGTVDEGRIKTKLSKFGFGSLLVWLKNYNLLPWQKFDFDKIAKKIKKIQIKNISSKWGDYQSPSEKKSFRFKEVSRIVDDFKISSAVELGGNQGVFSQLLIEETKVEKVICTDYDDTAIDALYLKLKGKNLKITPAVLDFIFSDEMPLDKRTYERFRADAVFVLDVTHHLILTQNIPLDYIFKTVSKFTNHYVFIEFMPLGLYSNNSKVQIPVPSWYNVDWFKRELSKFCYIICEEKLEANRILFVGEKIEYFLVKKILS